MSFNNLRSYQNLKQDKHNNVRRTCFKWKPQKCPDCHVLKRKDWPAVVIDGCQVLLHLEAWRRLAYDSTKLQQEILLTQCTKIALFIKAIWHHIYPLFQTKTISYSSINQILIEFLWQQYSLNIMWQAYCRWVKREKKTSQPNYCKNKYVISRKLWSCITHKLFWVVFPLNLLCKV